MCSISVAILRVCHASIVVINISYGGGVCLDGTHVHFGFKGARSTVAGFDFRIEHVVKLVNSCAKPNEDMDGQDIFGIEANEAEMSAFFWRFLYS